MKKRVTVALFVIMGSVISVAIVAHNFVYKSEQKKMSATVVIPKANKDVKSDNDKSSEGEGSSSLVSLVPLEDDEILLDVLSLDFDGDGCDDQVNSVKTLSSPYISLIVGLYNPSLNVYERKSVIKTNVSSVQTFSCTGIDLTGDHRNALVYQGFSDGGESVFQAYFINNRNGSFSLSKIADFSADGTIFIQQQERFDAYERANAKGASFPIWVYRTDGATQDQLQIKYSWNENDGVYKEDGITHVAGSRIAAKELAKIQDGTVATFANFLNGLWAMNDVASSENRYLFFDYNEREVIFFKDDVEEVYKWAHSNVRRNGMYLSTVNQEIENLQRKVDISLKSKDEISVRIQDDVRMLIGESPLWDGSYKKLSQNMMAGNDRKMKNSAGKSSPIVVLEKQRNWKISDGTEVSFSSGSFSLRNSSILDNGSYAGLNIDGKNFIQFRSYNNPKYFMNLYKIDLVEKDGENTVIIEAYKSESSGVYSLEQRPVVLTKSIEKNQ